MREIVYDSSSETLAKICSEYSGGDLRVLCPECREEMIVVTDEEAMKRTHRHAGIYCPNGHVQDLLELASVRHKMKQLFRDIESGPRRNAAAGIIAVDPDEQGWVTCPGLRCGLRFSLEDQRFVVGPDLWRHGCGQRIRRRQTGS